MKTYFPFGQLTLVLAMLISQAGIHQVQADVIDTDIFVSGDLVFDEANSFNDGAVDSSGTFYARENGVETNSAYSGDVVTGANPLEGNFTQHGNGVIGQGDGYGIRSNGEAVGPVAGPPLGFRADFDQPLGGGLIPLIFVNTGPKTFRVEMSLTYDHSVSAAGTDAFVRSDYELDLNGASIFDTEIISDTVFGNEIDEVPTGQSGGSVTQTGVFQFEFLLTPYDLNFIEIDYTLVGAAFSSDGASVGNSDFFLSIDNVQQIPEPGSLSIVILAGVVATVRRGRRRA